jgi:NAD(P)-dependent dehydrogenase (short-subunit alcohol dehydrogenase family)
VRLEGKIALVTGGAGGIGAAICELFTREGATVYLCDLHVQDGEALAEKYTAQGKRVHFLPLDVTDGDAWQTVLAHIEAADGRLDVLVNNAGISGSVPDRMDLAYFDKQWGINARGTFLGMKMARDLLAASGRASIINMSSVLGLIAHEITHMGYNASKGAVRLMSKAAAVQFADQGIRVNSVHPGWMSAMRTSVSSADPEQRRKLNAEVPLKRSGTAEEAAQAVLFLASDESSYVTGSELVVDGGLSAR